jgi:hypothetical protein
MKALNELHRFGQYGHIYSPSNKSLALNGSDLYTYLLSIRDVVAALGIMILICASSLLTLYTALGAL